MAPEARSGSVIPFILLIALILAGAGRALADLSSGDWLKAAEKAESALKRGDDREAGAALARVADDDSERAAKLIGAVFTRLTPPPPAENEYLYDKAYAAVEKLKAPRALVHLRKDLAGGSKDWRWRVLLVDNLGARGKSEEEALVTALS